MANSTPKSILRKIIDIISVGDTDQDTITSLTEEVMTEYSFKTMRDNEEMYYYDITGDYTSDLVIQSLANM